MNKIVVVGSINMDVVTRVQAHPRAGETVSSSSLAYIPGGKGANQAVAASRLTDGVQLVGKVGNDSFGQTLHAFLRGENLNLDHLHFSATQPTGAAFIAVNAHGENTIIITAGANGEILPADVAAIPLSAGDVVMAQFEIPQNTTFALFERARQVGAVTILNPAPAQPMQAGLLSLVDYLIVNETELSFYAQVAAIPADLPALMALARGILAPPMSAVIVTLGARGALCVTPQTVIEVAGLPVLAVDTTGAGDCFAGALAVALFEQQPLPAALAFANRAAAYSVQHFGASSSLPYRRDVE
jgi:ribokinase